MGDNELGTKLDRALGRLDAIIVAQDEQGSCLNDLCVRVALVEKGVSDTKDLVEAYTTTKAFLRFAKWIAGFFATAATLFFALKSGGVIK